MSWIRAFTNTCGTLAMGILAFVISAHALFTWGLTLWQLSGIAVILAAIALIGDYLPKRPRRHKTPDSKLPANAHLMNRTAQEEIVISVQQFENLKAAIFDNNQEPRP